MDRLRIVGEEHKCRWGHLNLSTVIDLDPLGLSVHSRWVLSYYIRQKLVDL